MSLNGLEASDINEAYHAALNEGGYWFLLQYSARDEVTLHGKGNGGVAEAQEAVQGYGEESPLYGFIHFRRRKVILKYVPEGTSRLLQARVAVHFQAIEDKLTPRDAVFAFARAQDLKESALSSEIALHTAASIRSTSESHLSGITEDETDTKSEATQKPDRDGAEGGERNESSSCRNDAQTRHEKANEILNAMRSHERSPSQTPTSRPRTASDTNKALPPTPANHIHHHTKPPSMYDFDARSSISGMNGRMSSQSARPSTGDLSSADDHKPKVKLGPRPSTDSIGRTSNFAVNGGFRPISALPVGLRIPVRKVEPSHPTSEKRKTPFASTPPPSIPLPPAPPTTPTQPSRLRTPTTFSGQAPSVRSPDSKVATITPEKRRLMKALQLRQKRLAAQKNPKEPDSQDNPTAEVGTESSQGLRINSAPAESFNGSPDRKPKKPSSKASEHSYIGLEEQDSALGVCNTSPPSFPHESQDSPISGAEQSEGQSTQASSLSGEEPPAQKLSHNSGETIKAEGALQDMAEEHQPIEPSLELTANEPSAPSQTEILEEKAELSLKTLGSRNAPAMSISLIDEPSPCNIQLTKDESLTTSVSSTSTHNGQESSTIEFGGDGQESDSQPEASSSDASVTQVKDEASERLPLQVSVSSIRHAPGSSPNTTNAASQLVQSTLSTTEMKSNYLLDRELSEHVDEDDDGDLIIPIQLNLELEEAAEGHFLESQSPKEIISDIGLDEPQASDTHETGNIEEITSTGKPQPSQVTSEKVDTKDDGLDKQLAHGINKGEPNRSESRSAALEQELAPSRKGVDLHLSLKPSTSMVSLSEGEIPITKPSTAETVVGSLRPDSFSDARKERKTRPGVVSLLRRTSSPENSDEQFLSDDSFLEELKTVSVQEAKPVSVSKSPIKPVFSRNAGESKFLEKPKTMRSVSSPLVDRSKGEEASSSTNLFTPSPIRSFSGSHSPYLNSKSNFIPAPKKMGVSSSISKRIKALEQSSSRPTSPTLQATPHATFISLRDRKSSLKGPPATPDGNVFPVGMGRPNTAHPSLSTPSDPVKHDPWGGQKNPRPGSISVTATIVRDHSGNSVDEALNPSGRSKMGLLQSPLVVEHQKMDPPPLPPLQPPRPRFARHASARSGSSSSSDLRKEMSPKASRRESFASWRSGSSRNDSDLDPPRSPSNKSLNGGLSEEKKDSKRSRLLKRMSNISSVSRRSIASALSPGPKEPSIVEHQEPTAQPPSLVVDLGDVNIQFPDTLLWKRRHMLIDEHGVLVVSPSTSDRNAKIIIKRFPLADFRPPYTPDQDRQELPNSVILDFKDGSTLQCACESSRGQVDILNSLRKAHSIHQS